jgi:hypothetical protein
MRPFTLRQRRLILRSASAAGLTLLAYIFEAILKSPLSPFGFALPPPPGFLFAVRGTFIVRSPLPSPISELTVCRQAATPLQDLSILRDQSAQPDSIQRSLPLRVARFSFAPRSARNNYSFTLRHGSSFRIRDFPPGARVGCDRYRPSTSRLATPSSAGGLTPSRDGGSFLSLVDPLRTSLDGLASAHYRSFCLLSDF